MGEIILPFFGGVIGLGFIALLGYTALYLANELEKTEAWPLGRALKGLVGGVAWAMIALLFSALLFGLGLILWAVYLDQFMSYPIFRFWAIQIAVVLMIIYALWGIYNGAANRLAESIE